MNAPEDLTSEEQRIRQIVISVVSRYSTRNLVAMIAAAFTAGAWATKVQWEINAHSSEFAEAKNRDNERVKEWTLWRAGATGKINETRWIVDNHEVRITTLEKK